MPIYGGIGALLQGLTGGLERADQRKRQREALDLQKKKLDIEEKLSQHKLREAITQSGLADEFRNAQNKDVGDFNAAQFEGTQSPLVAGPQPEREAARQQAQITPETPVMQPQRTAGDILKEMIVRTHPEKLIEKPGTTMQDLAAQKAQIEALFGPASKEGSDRPSYQLGVSGGKVTARPVPVEQAPKGDVSDVWARFRDQRLNEAKASGQPPPDILTLRDEFNRRVIGQTAQERSAAATRGSTLEKLQGTGSPYAGGGGGATAGGESPYIQLQRKQAGVKREESAIPESADTAITSMRTIIGQLDKINPDNPQSLYSPEFVGPVAGVAGGLKEKYGETPIIGGLVGGKIGSKEAQFRQVVNGLYNEIANLRGGKVLPEQELKRIEKEATTLTVSPEAFKARYKGFRNMVEGMLRNRISAVGSSRGNVGPASAIPPPPSGWRPLGQ